MLPSSSGKVQPSMPFVEVNGTSIHYQDKGSGLPILFLHPPLLEGSNFHYQLEQLSDHYRIIAMDFQGHGKSGHSSAPVTFSLMARDIRGLLDVLAIPQALICGYSAGGSVALEAMLTFPDRFLGGILLSATSEVSDPLLKSKFRVALCTTSLHVKRLMTASIAWTNADSPQTYRMLYSNSMTGNIRSYMQYYRSSVNYNCTDRLKEIRVPVLLLYGGKDSLFRKYANLLKDRLPDAELDFVPGAKHHLPTKWAVPTNERIRQWIGQHAFHFPE